MNKVRIAILISGRGSNMQAILQNIQQNELGNYCEAALVLANVESAPGLITAESFGVPTVTVPSKGKTRQQFEQELMQYLAAGKVDYIVLAGFNRILSPCIIAAYKNRIVNIHPADTRAYQGLHGYQWAFDNKLQQTKITVHFVDEGVDTGEIIMQCPVDLTNAVTLEDIVQRGLAAEHIVYSQALTHLFKERM